ncbi:MAG: DUF1800 domain-containing protein [Chitinophagaceae bacterium]
MKNTFRSLGVAIVISCTGLLLSSFFKEGKKAEKQKMRLPYKQAGLTEQQAAAHLLSRFTYGATPGQADEVVKIGLEKWLSQQLNGAMPDDSLNGMLSGYDALSMSNKEILANFPRGPQVLRMAIKDGSVDKDSVDKGDKKEYRETIKSYMDKKGLRPEQELFRQFINQKILRAAYSNNQLREILTDFWFNHFNVSITKNDCAQFIPAYERDVIRPNVFGKFEDLLLATAKSPAMLLYLDNFTSAGVNEDMDMQGNGRNKKQFEKRLEARMDNMTDEQKAKLMKRLENQKKAPGLNENYAREVMELHTLGVDGGYTQSDVTQAARVLTGWTIFPITDYGQAGAMQKIIDKVGEDKLTARGFTHEGDFLFAANRHDTKDKIVLGKSFAAGGGYDEGVQLLEMLAHNTSTAKFISKKLATRFVSDNPPQSLLDKMTKTFMEKDGDITEMIITMVSSPEFWSKDALREKTKSPFEFAMSAVRSLDAQIAMPIQLNNWITKMGQKMYFYQAPTGFPDKGQYWINTGSLLNRMNFGLALASKRIPGISFDLAALNHNHEPESAEAALTTYAKIMLPERDLAETIKRLTPMINDPEFGKKVADAASKTAAPVETNIAVTDDNNMMMNESGSGNGKQKPFKERINKKGLGKNGDTMQLQMAFGNNSMLSQVVGIIIGSPEFQRK